MALNAFFVAAEFALVREARVRQLDQDGSVRDRVLQDALEDPDAYLTACRFGITIASLGLGWVGVPLVSSLVAPVLEGVGVTSGRAVGITSFVLGFAVVAYAHLVLGGQVPKYFSLHKTDKVAFRTSRPLRLFVSLFRPVVWLVNFSAGLVLRPWGVRIGEDTDDRSEKGSRSKMGPYNTPGGPGRLTGAFDFGDKVAREIMVPRPDIEVLSCDTPLEDLAEAAAFGRFTRYPVYEGDLDRVLGFVHVKDLFRAASEEPERFDIRALVRECLVVPENKLIEHLLKEFQGRKLQMAIVIDEWGSVEGLITIEDVLEELVGEIQDEFDEDEAAIEELGEDLFAVDGRIPTTAVNERFGLELRDEDFDTIGGYVLGVLGRPPDPGDTVEAEGITLTVKAVDGPRVSMLTLRRTDAAG